MIYFRIFDINVQNYDFFTSIDATDKALYNNRNIKCSVLIENKQPRNVNRVFDILLFQK